jgi:pimeloyl-ACP methyl ester carboxylesterase
LPPRSQASRLQPTRRGSTVFISTAIRPVARSRLPTLRRILNVWQVSRLTSRASDFTAEARADLQQFKAFASLPDDARMRAFMQLQVGPLVQLPSPPDGPQPGWMATRPAGVDAFLVALEAHDLAAAQYRAFERPVLYTWGSLTNPRWDAMRDRLAALFPDFGCERFEGVHHLNTSHQSHPDRVAQLLRDLWKQT